MSICGPDHGSEGWNPAGRQLDPTAANLILVADKVREVLEGRVPLPEVVELFLTNFCSFECPHCRCRKHHGDPTQFFDLELLTGFLDELRAREIRTIELGGGGEPLEHPAIADVLQLLRVGGFRVGLITNGYVLTRRQELVEPLLAVTDWIRFSIDAISETTYRHVHGRPDLSYAALREAVARVVDGSRRAASGLRAPRVGLKLIIQRVNQAEVVTAVDEAMALGVHYLQFKWLEGHPWALSPVEREPLMAQLRERLEGLPPDRLIVDLLPGYGGATVRERCMMSVLHPLVDWDGTIYLCAFFHHRKTAHAIGNLRQGGFFASWGSPHHRAQIAAVNPAECAPNCPLLRYNPVVEFIRREAFRFRYI